MGSQAAAGRQLQRLETGSLTGRVLARLDEAIADGVFGEVLPSENQLAEQLGVSRATVRAALTSLEDKGLITRQRGVGTRINTSVSRIRLNLDRVIGFWDLIAEAGHEPSIAHTKVSTRPAGPEVASRLNCDADDELFVIDRLFMADGEPAIVVAEMVLLSGLRAAVPADEVPESVFTFASTFLGRDIDHTIVEIRPDVSDEETGQLLQLGEGTPLLRLLESHYADGSVLMFSDIAVVDRFIRFNIVRRGQGRS